MNRACLSCGIVIAATASRCTDCQRAQWRSQPSREARGYDRRWRRISRKVRARDPLCTLRLPGCTVLATAADHIVPMSQGGVSSIRNAQAACGPCNNAKKAIDHERKAANV